MRHSADYLANAFVTTAVFSISLVTYYAATAAGVGTAVAVALSLLFSVTLVWAALRA